MQKDHICINTTSLGAKSVLKYTLDHTNLYFCLLDSHCTDCASQPAKRAKTTATNKRIACKGTFLYTYYEYCLGHSLYKTGNT